MAPTRMADSGTELPVRLAPRTGKGCPLPVTGPRLPLSETQGVQDVARRPCYATGGATITTIRPGRTALEGVLFQHYLAAGHVLATGTNRSNLSRHRFS